MLRDGWNPSKFQRFVGILGAPNAVDAQSTCARIGRNTAPLGMGACSQLLPTSEMASPLANRVSKARLNFAAAKALSIIIHCTGVSDLMLRNWRRLFAARGHRFGNS
jgi:hypothetical protein